MRLTPLCFIALIGPLFSGTGGAQTTPTPPPHPESRSITVPITLDHDRIMVEVELRLADGTTKPARAWVDNGNPELWMSQTVATLMGFDVSCEGQVCSGKPKSQTPLELLIGGMKILVPVTREIKVAAGSTGIAPGMPAEINIPSTLLRNYDVLIDFPGRQFTLAQRGTLKFNGVKGKAIVNPSDGMLQISSQIENKKYNLSLDLGSSISFLSEELFNKLLAAHAAWPHMTGMVGPANVWGGSEEMNRKVMRIDRLQYGPIFLTDVVIAESPNYKATIIEKHAVASASGVLGAEALLNYRVGLDYAHSAVYFEIGSTFKVPDFDVIGLILRPEADGRFTILGVADFDGKPSIPQGQDGVQAGDQLIAVDSILVQGSTMGHALAMLGGEPGKERTLTVERGGKKFNVAAQIHDFLDNTDKDSATK